MRKKAPGYYGDGGANITTNASKVVVVDMSKYIAYIIDTLNHDTSISDLLDPSERIQKLLTKYKKEQEENN